MDGRIAQIPYKFSGNLFLRPQATEAVEANVSNYWKIVGILFSMELLETLKLIIQALTSRSRPMLDQD